MGIGFTLALFAMASIREIFGNGTFFGLPIPILSENPISILTLAPGGLMVYGILIAAVNFITKGKAIKKKDFSCAGCPSAGTCHGGCASAEKEAK